MAKGCVFRCESIRPRCLSTFQIKGVEDLDKNDKPGARHLQCRLLLEVFCGSEASRAY